MKPELMTALFTRAHEEEIGLVIETDNVRTLEVRLNEHRKAVGKWQDIIIAWPSVPDCIFLVKKSVELDP